MFQAEFEFTLPKGYVDENGALHRAGVMRLATAADEILPLKDPRAKQNPAYIRFIVLSRVIVKLGSLKAVTPKIVESLYASDLAYLQAMYNRINGEGSTKLKAACPNCRHEFSLDPGEPPK